MSVTIRPLQPSDREEWNPLWQGYLTFYESELSSDVTDHTWARLIGDTDDLMGFAALGEDGELIGIVHYIYHQTTWSIDGYCYLEDLFVNPKIRGGGIGEALITAVKEQAIKDGKSQLYWVTQHENFRARGLYNRVAGTSVAAKYEIEL